MKYTIGQIQEVHSLGDLGNLDKKIEALAILTNRTIDQVEGMSMDAILEEFKTLNFIPSKTEPKFIFKHLGKKYKLLTNPLDLKAHQWIELQEIYNGDIIESLNKIMALLSVESSLFNKKRDIGKKEFDKRCEDFLSLDFAIAYNYALFFSKVYPELLKATLSYLKTEVESLQQDLDLH